MKKIFAIQICLCISILSFGQNVGVGTSVPSEKLEVEGVIFTNQGGVMFPDSTLQTTAFPGQEGDTNILSRRYAVMEVSGLTGPFNGNGISDGFIILSEMEEMMATFSSGPGPVTASLSFSDFSIKRNFDLHSWFFVDNFVAGQVISELIISFIQESSSGDYVYASIRLENARVSSYQQSFEYAQALKTYEHVEKVSFLPEKFMFKTFTVNGQSECTCYDIENNTTNNCGCN